MQEDVQSGSSARKRAQPGPLPSCRIPRESVQHSLSYFRAESEASTPPLEPISGGFPAASSMSKTVGVAGMALPTLFRPRAGSKGDGKHDDGSAHLNLTLRRGLALLLGNSDFSPRQLIQRRRSCIPRTGGTPRTHPKDGSGDGPLAAHSTSLATGVAGRGVRANAG